MRTWRYAAALTTLLVASSSFADEAPNKSADDEIEESKATLAESQAQAAPPLERGTPYKPSIMPWVLGGVGIASIVTGGVFILISLSDQSKSEDFEKLAAARDNPNEQNDLLAQAKKSHDNADTNQTIGVIAGGAGVALLGAGIVWALVDGPPKENQSARIRPFVSPQSAGGTLSYVF